MAEEVVVLPLLVLLLLLLLLVSLSSLWQVLCQGVVRKNVGVPSGKLNGCRQQKALSCRRQGQSYDVDGLLPMRLVTTDTSHELHML
jgi:hypothetical protein